MINEPKASSEARRAEALVGIGNSERSELRNESDSSSEGLE